MNVRVAYRIIRDLTILARTSLNYSFIVIIQFFSMIYCIDSRFRRVAVLNRKVSTVG
jgi:hypothetical protein